MMNSKKSKIKKKSNNMITYNNRNIGFSLSIPDTWMEVKKTSYKDLGINENTLFVFVIDKFTSLTAVFSGFHRNKKFTKAFDKIKYPEKMKILLTGENDYNDIASKYLIIESNNKKIMNNFCIINGMLINFTINIDPKNRIFDSKELNNDDNYKLIKDLLKTIEVFEPTNPPVLVEYDLDSESINSICEKELNREIDIKKTTAQLFIENECKYKNILTPNFYLKYIYTKCNSEIMLSIINDEIYFKGLNDSFRLIKVDKTLTSKIKNIVDKNYPNIVNMDLKYNDLISNSYLIINSNKKYLGINLLDDDNDLDVVNNLLSSIINTISKYTDTNFEDYDLLPKKHATRKTFVSEEVAKEAEELLNKMSSKKETKQGVSKEVAKEAEELLNKMSSKKETKPVVSEEVAKEAEKLLNKMSSKKETKTGISEEVAKEAEKLLNKMSSKKETKPVVSEEVAKEAEKLLNKMSSKKETKPVVSKEVAKEAEELLKKFSSKDDSKLANKESNTPIIPVIVAKEANLILNKIKNEEKIEEYQDNHNDMEYDLTDFDECYHNIDGHNSFRFLFPPNSGNKNTRDFNVFDIEQDDEIIYRIFIFKCEDKDKYELKLKDWMNKNIESSKTAIKDTYSLKTEDSLEIRTYIFENDRFYKVVYQYGYLIAVSGIAYEDRLYYSDIILNTVEIGEDNRNFIESYDRKLRSIRTLEAQGIPYIDELPIIASSYEIAGKTIEEIAKRAIVLCVTCNFASDILGNKKKRYLKESKKFFNKLLDTYSVRDCMTKEERILFEKMDKDLAVQISWQFEGYAILLWTLGLIDEIEFPDTLVNSDEITAIVSACDTYRDFVGKCALRDVNEVLDLADLTYRYHWYCDEARINDVEPIINPEIVLERRRALNWLLTDQKWDNVEIDT